MMTSSNEKNSSVTGHLCGEFTGPRWIPRTKVSDAELLMFSLICVWINDWVNNREAGDSRRYRAHYDVIVMIHWNWTIVCEEIAFKSITFFAIFCKPRSAEWCIYMLIYNTSPSRMFLSLDLFWEYRIQHGANGPLYVTSSYSTWIFCRGVSGFATDCPCGVWCRGLTTCLLHVGPPFGNRILNNSWAVGLT